MNILEQNKSALQYKRTMDRPSNVLLLLCHVAIEHPHVPAQLSVHYAGMQRVHSDMGAFKSAGQLPGEEDIGQLALAVRLAAVIGLFAVQVGHLDLTACVCQAGHIHDPTRTGLLQQIQQKIGQQEVGQVICAQLQLDPVLGQHFGTAHNSGVVHEDV